MIKKLAVTDSDGSQRDIVTLQFAATAGGRGPCIVFAGDLMSENVNPPNQTYASDLQRFARQQGLPFMSFNYAGHGKDDSRSELSLKECTLGRMQRDLQTVLQQSDRPVLLVANGVAGAVAPFAITAHNQDNKRNSVTDMLLLNPVPAEGLYQLAQSQHTSGDNPIEHFNKHGVLHIQSSALKLPFPLSRAAYDELPHFFLSNPARAPFAPCPVSLVTGQHDNVSMRFRSLFENNLHHSAKTTIPGIGPQLGEVVTVAATACSLRDMERRALRQPS